MLKSKRIKTFANLVGKYAFSQINFFTQAEMKVGAKA
jgi:hypothetical protein